MKLLIGFWLFILYITHSYAYVTGDHIGFSKRTKAKDGVSFTQMAQKHSPRFGVVSTALLSLPQVAEDDEAGKSHIELSFANDRFITPWLPLRSSTGGYLRDIELTFTMGGSYILDVTPSTEYSEDASRPMSLTFKWREASMPSSQNALEFFVVIGTVFAVLLGVVALCDGGRVRLAAAAEKVM